MKLKRKASEQKRSWNAVRSVKQTDSITGETGEFFYNKI